MNTLTRSGRSGFWVFVAVSAMAVGIALLFGKFYTTPQTLDSPPETQTFSLPPFSESRYLNTKSDAHYIGSAACASCHPLNHQSYLHTAHSRSFSDINPISEQPDSSFEHKLSGRSYRIHRVDGQIFHEEILRNSEGKEV